MNPIPTEPAMRPRILLAANTTWYLYNFRRRLIAALQAAGYEVIAYSPADDYVPKLAALGVRHVPMRMRNAGTNPLAESLTLARMTRALACERPQALLTYTPKVNIYLGLAARVLGIPVIANVSGLGHGFATGGVLQVVVRALYRQAFRAASLVYFQNDEDRSEFVRAGLVARDKTHRLPGSGVDLERFRPGVRERAGGRDRVVFLLVARMLWEKGVGEYVAAARDLKRAHPGAEFRLLGFLGVENPSAVAASDVAAWEAEGVVRYLGVTDDVAAAYAEADCVVLPSYYREGVPRSLLEAAAMGLPLVTTDSVGCRDTVDDGRSGLLVPPRDARALARAMHRVIGMGPAERLAMGRAGRAKMEREFDEREVIARYLAAVRALLAHPVRAGRLAARRPRPR